MESMNPEIVNKISSEKMMKLYYKTTYNLQTLDCFCCLTIKQYKCKQIHNEVEKSKDKCRPSLKMHKGITRF